jgi:3-oxoacyl-[acyl-carrier protein] reductase
MDLGLKDKVILVAGASSGLGYAIARASAADGAKLLIGSRSADKITVAANDLSQETGAEVIGLPLDVRDPHSIEQWIAGAVDHYGRIDGLVVNAGGPPPGTFENFSDKDWQSAFELVLLSAIRMMRAVLPHMKDRGGSILAITSSSIIEPIDQLFLSGVMRAGVANLVKSLSRETAASSIRINNLVPGNIETGRMSSYLTALAEKRNTDDSETRAQIEQTIPAGRLGQADEFGKAGAFLLSDAASYITGTTLVVDGGAMKSIL